MKKSAVSFFIVLILLTGCNSNKSNIDLYEFRNALISADNTLPDMSNVDSTDEDSKDLFSYVSDIDYSKIKNYIISYSSEGKADEIIFVEMKKSSDVDEMKKELEEHLDSRYKLYSAYNPDEAKRSKNGLIYVKNNYLLVVVSNNQEKVKEEFIKYLNQ